MQNTDKVNDISEKKHWMTVDERLMSEILEKGVIIMPAISHIPKSSILIP